MADLDPPRLVRQARERAGLSQRELAHRARTSQSVIARIERGATDPSAGTLRRILAAAGVELSATLVELPVRSSHMLADVARILRLTPEQRLIEVRNLSRLQAAAHRG